MIDSKPYAVGVDVARALGYAKPSQAVIDHCKGIRKSGIPSKGGIQETNVISEGDIYRLIVKSTLPSAERFESWVFDEVLPQIRKTGSYSLLSPEEQMAQGLLAAQKLLDQTKLELTKAKQLVCELQPKATYYDLVLQNKSLLSVTKIAKDYGKSAIWLNTKLHEYGIQFKQGDQWFLYQKYAQNAALYLRNSQGA